MVSVLGSSVIDPVLGSSVIDHVLSSSVIDHVLGSSVIDPGFEPRSGQTKYYNIGMRCFSAKHAELRRNKESSWSYGN